MSQAAKRRRTSHMSSCPRYITRSYIRELCDSGLEGMGPYFGSLPVEMIDMMLSYLDAPSLSCLGSTCRALRKYTEKTWKPLCNRLGLLHFPTVLCVANPSNENSEYSYDISLQHCRQETRWKIAAKRNWLYSRWKCVICYRSCSHRVDVHFDITLCDNCHPLFYRRKCHSKEQFSLTEKDLRAISSDSYEFLVSDLIAVARAKYGGKEALEQRLKDKLRLKDKREAEKQCALVQRESLVVSALKSHESSYLDISSVDARCMPYVSSSGSYFYAPQQSADDAAKWLIAWKNRQETRQKSLLAEITARATRCKGCRARYDSRLFPVTECSHVTAEEAKKIVQSIKENFHQDIVHYSRHGQLYLEVGVYDMENRSAQELFLRAERREKLLEELESRKTEWPDILRGVKDPMNCSFAQDFVYKGQASLDTTGSKCRLRKAKDVARVILAQAKGWDFRHKQLSGDLSKKSFYPPFTSLKLESQLLIDDYIDNPIVIRGESILACSSVEIADRIAVVEGVKQEEKSTVAQRCARIYAECNPKPDFEGQRKERRNSLLRCMGMKPHMKLGPASDPCWSPAQEYINCGTTTSLFGYKLTTPEAAATLIKQKQLMKLEDAAETGV